MAKCIFKVLYRRCPNVKPNSASERVCFSELRLELLENESTEKEEGLCYAPVRREIDKNEVDKMLLASSPKCNERANTYMTCSPNFTTNKFLHCTSKVTNNRKYANHSFNSQHYRKYMHFLFKDIICNIYTLKCLKTTWPIIYFVESCTYISRNVTNNVIYWCLLHILSPKLSPQSSNVRVNQTIQENYGQEES